MTVTADLAIGEYALLSDCRSAALVSREGSIDWLCAPRFDSPSFFARLLDADAGHWRIRALGDASIARHYLDASLVLETTWQTASGTLVVTDAMALGPNERGHDLGTHSPGILLRTVACVDGSVEVEIEYAPRPEYGLVRPILLPSRDGILARGGGDVLFLSNGKSVEFTIEGATARARVSLRAGERFGSALAHCSTDVERPTPWSQREIRVRLADTLRAWNTWSKLHQSYTGPWSAEVHHSGRVLQGLTYVPTGAIVAAPTTSLPEVIGGGRNWDYRYAWLRDANVTMEALWIAACPDEAYRFFSWMAHAVATPSSEERLQIMFGVGGEHDLTERELPHLRGWRASRPVRVGNGAWQQVQLDAYGQVLATARRFKEHLTDMDGATRKYFVTCADAAAKRWNETDSGIWELRGAPQHFVYSKVMCWQALDAAVDLGASIGSDTAVAGWRGAREDVRAAILEHGYNEKLGTFVQAFGGEELDASALVIPIAGFLPATDPRVRSTIEAIAKGLVDERGLIYRYRCDDGMEGTEGTFLLCTFWLARALALGGDVERAKETFERALACANDVGLFAEEVDAATGQPLGNFPQAFSHVGLVTAAYEISLALEATSRATVNGTTGGV